MEKFLILIAFVILFLFTFSEFQKVYNSEPKSFITLDFKQEVDENGFQKKCTHNFSCFCCAQVFSIFIFCCEYCIKPGSWTSYFLQVYSSQQWETNLGLYCNFKQRINNKVYFSNLHIFSPLLLYVCSF